MGSDASPLFFNRLLRRDLLYTMAIGIFKVGKTSYRVAFRACVQRRELGALLFSSEWFHRCGRELLSYRL